MQTPDLNWLARCIYRSSARALTWCEVLAVLLTFLICFQTSTCLSVNTRLRWMTFERWIGRLSRPASPAYQYLNEHRTEMAESHQTVISYNGGRWAPLNVPPILRVMGTRREEEHHLTCKEDESRFLLMSEDGKWHRLALSARVQPC